MSRRRAVGMSYPGGFLAAMDRKRYLECLAADERRLRELAGGADLATPVPSCPDWTLADLVEHVALVARRPAPVTQRCWYLNSLAASGDRA